MSKDHSIKFLHKDRSVKYTTSKTAFGLTPRGKHSEKTHTGFYRLKDRKDSKQSPRYDSTAQLKKYKTRIRGKHQDST